MCESIQKYLTTIYTDLKPILHVIHKTRKHIVQTHTHDEYKSKSDV